MSFVTTQPGELLAAASKLQAIGTAMEAENDAAAAPTVAIAPAAADEVSALQATQFAAYGQLYQSVSAQATTINQMLVNTLGSNAGSYGDTEAANQTATGSTSLSGLLGSLTGGSGMTSAAAVPAAGSGSSSGAAVFAINGSQNFAAAGSDLISMASIGTLPGFGGASSASASVSGVAGLAGLGGPVLAGASGGGLGAGPATVTAGMGQSASMGGMSVPPGWAAQTVSTTGSAPVAVSGPGWAGPPPQGPPAGPVPAGMPSMASAGRGGYGIGAPRYGSKPTVMPKPTVV